MTRHRIIPACVAATLLLAGCASTPAAPNMTITLVTHDSFVEASDALARFEQETGYTIEHLALGDAGTMVNQLILTKDRPLGDVAYGIDNTLAGRALAHGILGPYVSPTLAPSARQYAAGHTSLTPIDLGDVCVNVDHEWFAAHKLAEPTTLADLTDPAYADLLVVQNPATSSPGLAFLLATISAQGDQWPAFWTALVDNGVRVADGWSTAYGVDFSGGEGNGPRPLVVSYASSPALTPTHDGTASRTGALLDTCFRQIEYAAVLAGTDNPRGARALIDFLTTAEFQATIPTAMYMYPADATVELPDQWARLAPLSPAPHDLPMEQIDADREQWIEQWTEIVLG